MLVSIQKFKIPFNKESKTFSLDGKLVVFKTQYTLVNDKTGNEVIFELSHSTGSEWDEATKWIYKNKDLTLEVSNHVLKGAEERYLKAKTLYNQ